MVKRYLSSLEKFFYDRSCLNLHSCFFVGIQLNELPDKQLLIRTLRKTIDNHPQLHFNVALDNTNGDEPYLRNITEEPIVFNDVIEYITWNTDEEANINQIFQTYNFPYYTQKPLWKILVNEKERRLYLLLDHVLFDGMSGVQFWNTFMDSLSNSSSDRGAEDERLYVPSENQDAADEYHPYEIWPTTWKSRLSKLAAGVLFRWFPDRVVSLNPQQVQFNDYLFPRGLLVDTKSKDSICYNIRNDNCQRNIRLSPAHLRNVLASCKLHKISLTSFLAAIFAIAIEKGIETEDFSGSFLKIDIPMNTRPACAGILKVKEDKLQMGNLVASAQLTHNLKNSGEIWDVAQAFQGTLEQQTRLKVIDTINAVKILDVVDAKKLIEAKIKAQGPSGTFEITNLGFQSFNSDKSSNASFIVQDAFFNEPQGISDVFTCCIITTSQGGLNCSVSYPKDIKYKIEACLENVTNFLEQIKSDSE